MQKKCLQLDYKFYWIFTKLTRGVHLLTLAYTIKNELNRREKKM